MEGFNQARCVYLAASAVTRNRGRDISCEDREPVRQRKQGWQ